MSLGVYREKFNNYSNVTELVTSAELISISEEPRTNTNGTVYYPCTVKIIDMKGKEQTITAIIYQGNLDRANDEGGMKIGKLYSLTIVPPTSQDQLPLVKLSHLASSAGRATMDMFDFGDESTPETQPKVEFVDDNVPF
jgi:hypothetical protein